MMDDATQQMLNPERPAESLQAKAARLTGGQSAAAAGATEPRHATPGGAVTSHAELIAAIEAERAAMPEDQRLKAEAADAPMLRIGLRYALERAERAEANTPEAMEGLEQRLASMTKLAAAWQKEAGRARKDIAAAADTADAAEMRIWDAIGRPLTFAEVYEHLNVLRGCRTIAVEAINISAGTYEDAKKRVVALHHPVTEMRMVLCNECSVQRRTGPNRYERIAFVTHPCQTIRALNGED